MATELAKAYVQIIPSAQGIKGSISNVLNSEAGNAGNTAGQALGSNLVSKIKSIIVTAGIGKAISSSLTEGAALQQSLGGVETLFKDSADKVIANARNAYKTAGMSANSYMETVTGFSASLLQGLAGDTNKAADVADMALTDMSDNANKMGTSMESIQMAYQGFAKQNYTMLDNLKLGFGGTKTEMERLLAHAQELTGIEYNIDNLSDVYEAIHVVQEEMGITGTTALEASQTFAGSFAAMKAAGQDFLGNLALGENVLPSLNALADTTYTFIVNNFFPMITNIMSSLGEVIVSTDWMAAAQTLITRLRDDIAAAAGITIGTDTCVTDELMNAITAQLPSVLEKGVEMVTNLVNGILNTLPDVVNSGMELLSKFVNCILENLPKVLEAGVELVINIVNGVINSLPKIADAALNVFTKLRTTIVNNAPKLIESGITLIGKLAAGLIKAIPDLVAKIPTIITKVKNKFKDTDWKSVGKNIIQGIARGLTSAAGEIVSAAKEAARRALEAAKRALGIHSPSKVFEMEVGKMIDLGLAEGIKNNLSSVVSAMKKLSDETIGRIDTDFVMPEELQKIFSGELKVDDLRHIDWADMFEGVVFEIVNNVSLDGTPLKEKISDYTINKINSRQKAVSKAKGVFA